MPIKKRQSIEDKATLLANQLADRPYGDEHLHQDDELIVTSISITKSQLYKVEDLVTLNKRTNTEPKSVSALIRNAIEQFIT